MPTVADRDLVRAKLSRTLSRWGRQHPGARPSTWDILRASCTAYSPTAVVELERLAAEGVVTPAGKSRDGSRLWRIRPGFTFDEEAWFQGQPDAET